MSFQRQIIRTSKIRKDVLDVSNNLIFNMFVNEDILLSSSPSTCIFMRDLINEIRNKIKNIEVLIHNN